MESKTRFDKFVVDTYNNYWVEKAWEKEITHHEWVKKKAQEYLEKMPVTHVYFYHLLKGYGQSDYDKWIDNWVEIGTGNPWIDGYTDPPFGKSSILRCDNLLEFLIWSVGNNWCPGVGFSIGDLCVINQANGASEMLMIKQDSSFDSFSFWLFTPEKLLNSLVRILDADKETVVKWRY